jgi:tetratricopeptide (TPR) repeat protein
VVTQLPTSLYPLSEVENDHRMFFSFVGLIAAVVWAGWLLVERLPVEFRRQWRTAGVALVLLGLSGYAWGTHVRNEVWHDEESLWLDDVQKSPHNGRGLMDYGLTQMNKGAYPQALDYFTRALPYTPNYPSLEINLGVVNGALAGHRAGTERRWSPCVLWAMADCAWAVEGRHRRGAGCNCSEPGAELPARPVDRSL